MTEKFFKICIWEIYDGRVPHDNLQGKNDAV